MAEEGPSPFSHLTREGGAALCVVLCGYEMMKESSAGRYGVNSSASTFVTFHSEVACVYHCSEL